MLSAEIASRTYGERALESNSRCRNGKAVRAEDWGRQATIRLCVHLTLPHEKDAIDENGLCIHESIPWISDTTSMATTRYYKCSHCKSTGCGSRHGGCSRASAGSLKYHPSRCQNSSGAPASRKTGGLLAKCLHGEVCLVVDSCQHRAEHLNEEQQPRAQVRLTKCIARCEDSAHFSGPLRFMRVQSMRSPPSGKSCVRACRPIAWTLAASLHMQPPVMRKIACHWFRLSCFEKSIWYSLGFLLPCWMWTLGKVMEVLISVLCANGGFHFSEAALALASDP